jgi:K+-transporting ATPase ATPase C chain
MTKNSITDTAAIPKEMIFASASGLDPHISPEAALLQLNRVASARNFNEAQKQKVQQLIKNKTEEPQFFLLGEPRINVFELNLALDSIKL